jgi:hypothetical protein
MLFRGNRLFQDDAEPHGMHAHVALGNDQVAEALELQAGL